MSAWLYVDMSEAASITELVLECFRLNGRLLAAGDTLVRDLGLTSARWQVLGAIALSPVPLPVAHIARNMGLSRQNVQRLVDEMAAQGVLRFAPNPHHQRAKLVTLTQQGRALYDAAAEKQTPWAAALGEGLPASEVRAALALLRTMRSRLEDQPEGRSGEEVQTKA